MSTNAPKVLLRSEESDGEVSAIEITGSPERKGPPLHHRDFDETFYILEGELTFQLDDDVFTRRAGGLAFAPRGVAHTYAKLSSAPARALVVITPAGFERYFDGIAARISGTEPPPEAAKPIPEVVTLGPPLDETRGAR
jgi:quercetin dioxygenase-like cupin family protein